ncbi:MAG: hypothetical protein HC774_06300 [Sphingomonadales bacterium]|nr:hypothetical protein [Sphingomonadales bacterium]
MQTSTFPSGRTEVLSTDAYGAPFSRTDTIPGLGNSQTVNTYRYDSAGRPVIQSSNTTETFYDNEGVSRIETLVTYNAAGQSTTVRNVYGTDSATVPISSTTVAPPGFIDQLGNALTQSAGLVNLIQAIQGGNDTAIATSGLNLVNSIANPGRIVSVTDPVTGVISNQLVYEFPVLNGAAQIAGGVASFYNLANAIQNGDAFDQTYASLSTVNYLNITLNRSVDAAGQLVFTSGTASASLNTFLNGTGEGLISGGTAGVGVLGYLGLINGLRTGDPISIIQGAGPLIWGSAFTPWGIGIAVLSLLFAKDPEAWGVANVTYGEGFNNLSLKVNTSGEEFGPERVRGQLQTLINGIQAQLDQINAGQPEDQQLGLIAQRMPGISWRASDLGNPGYEIVDIDPLTGAQRYPYRRFDDDGLPFSSNPALYTVDLTDPEQRKRMDQALLDAALRRGAIAPLWEVKTAKQQAEGGQVDAGLSEEERAAKSGYSAALDTAYANANPNSQEAQNKRIGHFMPVALDVDGDGLISTTPLTASQVSFNWDGLNFKKNTAWVNANDAFLVLDRDFNQSVDSGAELLSNPLVADPAKGLRSLATWDANGDGKIDQYDPIYRQLKVWQDFNQDGDNTQEVSFNTAAGLQTFTVQDEASITTNGQSRTVQELRSLQSLGIIGIDYANNRYEIDSGLRNTGTPNGQIIYQSIQTLTLEASNEGVRYTPVGAGIRIDDSSGQSEILITQIQSQQAVYDELNRLTVQGETIGAAGALLYEDGVPYAWNPAHPNGGQGFLRQTILAYGNAANGVVGLLDNDTWNAASGQAATGQTIEKIEVAIGALVNTPAANDIAARERRGRRRA